MYFFGVCLNKGLIQRKHKLRMTKLFLNKNLVGTKVPKYKNIAVIF